MSDLTLNYRDVFAMTPDTKGLLSWCYNDRPEDFVFNGRSEFLTRQLGRALATYSQWKVSVVWESNPKRVADAQATAKRLGAKFGGIVPFESTAQKPATHLMRGYGLTNTVNGRKIAVVMGWSLREDGSEKGRIATVPEVYEWRDGAFHFHPVTKDVRESVQSWAAKNGADWQFDRENIPWTKYHFIAQLLVGNKVYFRIAITVDEKHAAGNLAKLVHSITATCVMPVLMDHFRRETLTHVMGMPFEEVHSFLATHEAA